ncbi:hypothetical protein HJC99_02615 [Candidatus Saccharibacteria bacterium]|nr:hypothetical protein [Candidatus Saccharibacteria bacterium]
MSLASSKLGRYALGLVASGGAALFLGGTALADVAVTGPTLTSVTTISNDVSTTTHTVTHSKSEVLVTGSSDQTPTVGGGPADPKLSSDATTSPAALGLTASLEAAPDAKVQASAAVATSSDVIGEPPAATVSAPVISQSVLHRAALAVISSTGTPVQAAPVASQASAPVPHSQPVPPQASGAFTALTLELAGTVVPKVFNTFGALVAAPVGVLELALLTLITVLISLLAQTYGTALRRSGYSTAARSDGSIFTFATPLALDYGSLRVPMVLFDGVRDQKMMSFMTVNAYKKGGE